MTYLLEYLHRRRIFWVIEQLGPELLAAQCTSMASCLPTQQSCVPKRLARGRRPA